MMKRSWLEVVNRFGVQLMLKRRGIKDSRIIDALESVDWEEGYFPLHEALFTGVTSCVTFPVEDAPEPSPLMMEHFEEECEYMTMFTFYIPKLSIYKDEALFDEILDRLQFVEHADNGNYMELFYLPTSNFASEDEEHLREYADQPYTFQLGVYDTGNIDPGDYVDFMEKLIAFNGHIEELIR